MRKAIMSISAIVAVFGLLAVPVSVTYGQGGALPKGNYKTKPAKPVKGTAKPGDTKNSTPALPCSEKVFFPGEESGVFTRDSKYLFLLTKNEKQTGKAGLLRYTVYKVDLEGRSAEAVYGLEQKGNVGLMLLGGTPVQAISTVSFIGPCADAFEGQAGAVSVSIVSKSEKAVQVAGDFYYVDGSGGRAIADMKKNAILELDGAEFQTRFGARFEKGNRPVYHDPFRKNLVAWHEDKKLRGIVNYFGENGVAGTRLAIPAWDTLLRGHGLFAAATVQAKANTVVIHEIPDWTGVAKKGDHVLKLPKEMSVSGAQLVPYFQDNLIAVLKESWSARTRNNDIYLFNYKTGKQITRVNPVNGIVPGFVGFSPNGKWLAIETRSQDKKHTTGLRLVRVDSGLAESVKLDSPK